MAPLPAWFRLLVAALLGTFAAVVLALGQPVWAAGAGVLGAVMLGTWARYHDVPRAAMAFNGQDKSRAWELLEGVPFGGRLLATKCRVYYHHVRARCLLHRDAWSDAAREAEAALRVRGIGEEAAGCHLAAAQAYAHMGDRDHAVPHIEAAQRLPHSEAVNKGVERVRKLLANA